MLIICSMTKDPEELVEGNLFHPELYLHIKDNRIHLPPLRERPDDIMPLAERAITRSGEDVRLTPDAESWLRAQPWPGNVRDLMNTVASAAGQCTSRELTAEDLEPVVLARIPAVVQSTESSGDADTDLTIFESSNADNLFKQHGDSWLITYQGKRFALRDAKGLHYIAWLLAHPGQEFHVLKLITLTEKQPANPTAKEHEHSGTENFGLHGMNVEQRTENPVLDLKYKSELARQLKELNDSLDYAKEIRDPSMASRLQEEIDIIRQTLVSNIGLGGRERRDPTRPSERARRAVYSNYARSLRAIGEKHPDLWKHFYNSIKTGEFLSYTPEHPPNWTL